MRLFAIGTCRLHNPLQTLAARGELVDVYAQMRLRYTYYTQFTS